MYSVPPGDGIAEWIGRIAGVGIVIMIVMITTFVIVEVVSGDDIELVQDMTTIPRWVYLMLLVILFMCSFVWLMCEWYMDRWWKYKIVYNLSAIYAIMIITTFALLVFHLASGRALFDFLSMIPVFYVPCGATFAGFAYMSIPQFKTRVNQTVYTLYKRVIRRQE
jgi:MFS superfamily sulfate permease-like transporter